MGKTFAPVNLRNGRARHSPMATEILRANINQGDLVQLTSFCTARGASSKTQRQLPQWEKSILSEPTHNDFISIVAEITNTVAKEGDKQHSEIWKSKVYSAPVRAQRSHLQSLSTRSLFSVTFIHYKVLIFPCKHPGPPPSPSRQCSSLRN